MTIRLAPASRRVGDLVRVHGALHQIVVGEASGEKTYVRLADGKEFQVSPEVQKQLALSGALTADTQTPYLESDLRDVVTADWGSFTEGEKASAHRKLIYMDALDAELDVEKRRREEFAMPIVLRVHAEEDKSGKPCPSMRSIARWSYRWIASGRDIRALADMNYRKGNRRDDDPYAWSDMIILQCIETLMMQAPYCSAAHTARVADALVHQKAEAEGLPLRPRLHGSRHVGAHRVYDLLEKFGYYERLTNQFGRKEARSRGQTSALGPQGDYALHEVEVDHTKLDIMVYDEKRQARGRPWLTVLIDRYSRMIVGYYISFEAPSWFSVMMALRLAVMPKKKYLDSLNYDFEFDWDCHGTPDHLYMDRGAEFRSESLRATAMVLRIKLHDLPRASGQLKGKVERWFRVENQGLLHTLPGYLGSNPSQRIEENAKPKLTIGELETVVAAFVVDIYNNRPHGKTKERPSKRYADSMANLMNDKLPPEEELLGPATNPTRTAQVGKNGLRFDNMIFQSDELRALWRRRNCIAMKSIVRFDPNDISTILVYDGVHRPWVKAHLVGEHGGKKISYEEVQYRMQADEPSSEEPEVARKRSRAILKLENLKDRLAPRKVTRKKPSDPKKRGEFTSRPVFDGEKSQSGMVGYDPDRPPDARMNDSTGPFGTPSSVQQFLKAESREIETSYRQVEQPPAITGQNPGPVPAVGETSPHPDRPKAAPYSAKDVPAPASDKAERTAASQTRSLAAQQSIEPIGTEPKISLATEPVGDIPNESQSPQPDAPRKKRRPNPGVIRR